MTHLAWIIFFFLLFVLTVSVIWFIWRLRHFSQSHHHTVLDDKLLQNMLGDKALSKDVKNALVRKSAGVSVDLDEKEQVFPDKIAPNQQDNQSEKGA